MNTHETKHSLLPFDTKGSGKPVVKGRTFSGMASTMDVDLVGDIVEPTAFSRSINEWRTTGGMIPLLDTHDGPRSIFSVIGKLLEARITDTGLWTRWEVIKGADGDAVLERIKGGYIDGLSIGYRIQDTRPPTKSEREAGALQVLTDLDLTEVSLVRKPANLSARIETRGLLLPDDPTRKALEAKLDVMRDPRGAWGPTDLRRLTAEMQLARGRSQRVRNGYVPPFEL